MSQSTTPAAVVFDASYIKSRKALMQAGGSLSRAACAAAVKAANLAIESSRLFEIQDLENLRRTAPSSTARAAISKALSAVFALAFGTESADKRGNVVYSVRRADCKSERLLEADLQQWRGRHGALKDLDSVRVRVMADAAAPDLDALQARAVHAYMAYMAAGGTAAAFMEAVKSAQADAAAKSAK